MPLKFIELDFTRSDKHYVVLEATVKAWEKKGWSFKGALKKDTILIFEKNNCPHCGDDAEPNIGIEGWEE